MMQEMVRIVAAALRDGTIGIAAQLATMPREGGDTAPPVPVIYDETSDLQTALDQIPDAPGPFLQVAAGALRENDITVTPSRKTEVDLVIRYAVRSSLTTRSLNEARQTERAVRRCLSVLPQQSDSLKFRNRAQLFHVTQYTADEARAPADDVALVIVMRFTVHGRDLRTMEGT
jgi:hypothetical protein